MLQNARRLHGKASTLLPSSSPSSWVSAAVVAHTWESDLGAHQGHATDYGAHDQNAVSVYVLLATLCGYLNMYYSPSVLMFSPFSRSFSGPLGILSRYWSDCSLVCVVEYFYSSADFISRRSKNVYQILLCWDWYYPIPWSLYLGGAWLYPLL